MAPPILSRAGLHTSAHFMVFYAALGAQMPFWPLWLGDWGLTAAEIGTYTALGVAARVVGGLIVPTLADRIGARRITVAVCAFLGALLFLGHLWIGDRTVLLVATLAVGAVLAGIGPISDALGLAAARVADFDFAKARSAGSLGFLAANLAIGALIAATGSGIVLWSAVALLLALAVLSLGHPGGHLDTGLRPPALREIVRVMIHPTFALFLVTAAFIQSSHAVLYAYGSLHWRGLGLDGRTIGALWAFAVAAEIVLLVGFGARLIRHLDPVRAMGVAAAAATLRWTVMMTDPTGWILWPLQALHALTFALGYLGAVSFIAAAVPRRYGAAAQGAMSQVAIGLATAAGMGLAALVFPVLGGLTYGIGSVFAVIGFALTLILARRWRGGLLPV